MLTCLLRHQPPDRSSLADRPDLTSNITLTMTLNSSCYFRTPSLSLAAAPGSSPSQPLYQLTVGNTVYPKSSLPASACPSSSFAFSIMTTPYTTPSYQALYDPPTLLNIPAQGSSVTTVTLVAFHFRTATGACQGWNLGLKRDNFPCPFLTARSSRCG